MIATRDQLFATQERKYGDVETTAGLVRFQSLTEGERVRILSAIASSDDKYGTTEAARVFAACVVDEDGNRLFRDEEYIDVLDMDATVVRTVFLAIDEAFGIQEAKELERIEDEAKN